MTRNQGMRNLQSAGRQVAKSSMRTGEKAVIGLSRWAATDHSGMTQALDRMPEMGCVDSIKYTVVHFLISMVSAVVGGIWIYLLVAYGIPLLITGHL